MTQQRCPYCNQPLPVHRMNVQMTSLEGRIFDLIRRGGDDGILTRDLVDVIWPNDPAPAAAKSLKVHISNINRKIAARDYRIISYNSFYCLRNMVKHGNHVAPKGRTHRA